VVPVEQSGPVQLASQVQVLVSLWNEPWPEQCSKHTESCVSQFDPVQPEVQWHWPWRQEPWPEQDGSTQSTVENNIAFRPFFKSYLYIFAMTFKQQFTK